VEVSSREQSFVTFFRDATGGLTPYAWQRLAALDGLPDVLPVPTGLGKTEVALAWAWRLIVDERPEPLHLVICLPMRSLVTQTVQRLAAYFDALRASWPDVDVDVHQLMGGATEDAWVLSCDKPWVLVGTQDQLLSRALNRGYAMLKKHKIEISMDGKGCWRDNVFVERLWRSVKYEEVYLRAYESVSHARESLKRYFQLYNSKRPHASLERRTPDEVFNTQPLPKAA
jgi:hypothetical protein